MVEKLRILFLCTGNSCRSQMAEGWTRRLRGDLIEPYSAGIERHGMNPYAIRVMREAGVDISGQRSKLISELSDVTFDYVITVCDRAQESCPIFPGKTRLVHRSFDDPPHLTSGLTDEESILECYRRVRDEIKRFISSIPEALSSDR